MVIITPFDNASGTLAIDKDASQDEIKRAYYSLAKQWHPDTNPNKKGAKEKFAEISRYAPLSYHKKHSAYETLRDEKKREIYNQHGLTGDE